tara:strand:- start:2624 stop:4996 length:2373 start_codon:yes stop_codon:yes gene_type:complete
MGKPSIPEAPAAPTPAEISAANVQTAEHMAKLSRAMEFGEELMRDVRNENGSRVKYEKVKTDVPTGYEPQYSNESINTSGPSDFSAQDGKYTISGTVNSKGELSGFTRVRTGRTGGSAYGDMDHLKGKSWASDEVQGYLKGKGWEKGFTGSQPLTSQVRSLTGYKNASGDVITANQYYKTSYDANGEVIGGRELVDRDEAVDVDFTGMGDIDRAIRRAEWEQEYGMKHADFLLDYSEKYGNQFVDQANDLLQRSDQTGYDAREMLGQLAMDYTPGQLPDLPALERAVDPQLLERVSSQVPELEALTRWDAPDFGRVGEMDALRRVGDAPEFGEVGEGQRLAEFGDLERAQELGDLEEFGAMDDLELAQGAETLERLTDIPEIDIDPESLAGREFAEREYIRKAQSGETSRVMGERAKRLARGRAAGLGNIFGGGAVIEEAAAVQEAEAEGQRVAMGDLVKFLQSGQTAGDYQSRVAQQNLANRAMGIQQRGGVAQAEFGMGLQRLGADREAALRERADELGAIAQRNQVEETEYQAAMQTLEANRQAQVQEYGMEAQRRTYGNEQTMREMEQQNLARERGFQANIQAAGFDNEATLRERGAELEGLAQRNQAEEAELNSLTQIVTQMNQARTGQFAMGVQATDQRNQAATADFQRQQQALAQRNQAAQQAYTNATQKTLTQDQMKQQQMANLQSFSGLQPVAGQYGMTGAGAQQSAAGLYQPPGYQPTNVMGMLQGQQQMAASNFGTQAGIWGQQAKIAGQPSGFGQVLGTVAGAFAGGAGQAWGAKKWG